MKITKIELRQRGERFNLEVDNSFLCSISATTLTHLNLYKDKEITEDEITNLLQIELENRFFDRVVNLLSSRMKTRRQVEQYLRELALKKKDRWFSKEFNDFQSIFERVMIRVEKLGLINDKEFAVAFVNGRTRSKPRGKFQIISELIAKGIDQKLAKEIVSEILPDNDDMIMQVYKKKFKEQNLDLKNRKQVDFLLRKGFDWDDISKLEKRLKDVTKDEENMEV